MGQYGELGQIDKGYLDENTTLVTVSIGGNDAGFGPVIKERIMNLSQLCQDVTIPEIGNEPLRMALPKHIQGPVCASIIQALQAIHRAAPNARIVLMGYPVVVEATSNGCNGVVDLEAHWIKEVT
ncbi:GDSL-type esterase/lipase family protein [Nonomuraea lactucae]|uniref:GDSL-type esterase/lipase family protein n=1 Tax=Nonomuraea lactucae TaxID=2249762 RepID=UPI0013B401A1|nr:GDSL-type esterase/lipase family protein [Nonomuraea lactucae]